MRKFLMTLSASLLVISGLNAAACGGWCDGWPKASSCCNRAPWPSTFNIDFGGGYRQDKFKWSIAGPNNYPNVLSEIQWRKLRIAQVGGMAKYVSCRNYAVRIDASYGRIQTRSSGGSLATRPSACRSRTSATTVIGWRRRRPSR